MSKWPKVPLADVLQLQRRWIKIQPTETYREIGVRSFGNGIFHKAPIQGNTLGDKRVLSIEPGDLVLNNVFAWEGAVAVAGPNESGMIGSHRFITYTVDTTHTTPEYLSLFFSTPEGREILLRASPGSAGRNKTLGLDRFISSSIPLPPLIDQRRLVALFDTLAAKIQEAQLLQQESKDRAKSFVSSLHLKMSGNERRLLGDVLVFDEDRTEILEGHLYPQVGVRGFGGGLFARETLDASQTTYKSFNRLYDGAVVLSQVKGWEGAIAVCPPQLVGRFVSPEYRTFRCLSGKASSEYLSAVFATPWFWTQLKRLTRGVGARRERIRPEAFLAIDIPMPSICRQEEALELIRKITSVAKLHDAMNAEFEALMPATLNQAFQGQFS